MLKSKNRLFLVALSACIPFTYVACDSNSSSANDSAAESTAEGAARTITFNDLSGEEVTCRSAVAIPDDLMADVDSEYGSCIYPENTYNIQDFEDSTEIHHAIVCFDQKWNYVDRDSCEETSKIITCKESLATPVPADQIEYIESLVGDCSLGQSFDGYTIEDENGDSVFVRCRAGKWEYADLASCGKEALCAEYLKNSDWGRPISDCNKENEGIVTDTACFRNPKNGRTMPGYLMCKSGAWEAIEYADFMCNKSNMAVGDTCVLEDVNSCTFGFGLNCSTTYTTYTYSENGTWVVKED